MTKGIRKILYAADAKDSPLPEANEIITRSPGMFPEIITRSPDMFSEEAE